MLKMSENDIKKIEKSKLPFIYRLILKLPRPNLDFLPEISHGIFWAIFVPIFIFLNFCLNLFLLVYVPFPTNLVLVGITPAVFFIFFARIMLERFINWWNATFGEPFEWELEKATEEYVAFLHKQESKKHKD